ncbi:hypothetical protein COX85_03040 [Candidatus Micrarchaeota archaeon CG_4_10_14_0_2_um_filter_55_9]|nr:MAG: hypothetical protein COX85_03040 [Candidatus Micrarchaeota archaeon CG_4_10_14_0_2_um_filter_55_9]
MNAEEKHETDKKEIQKLVAKNRDRITQMRDHIQEVQVLKDKRDAENAEVKKYKKQRDKIEERVNKLREALDQDNEKLKETGVTDNSIAGIQRYIEELEWIQQTEAITPAREKDLSKKINELRKKLPKSDEARKLMGDIRKERDELKKLNPDSKELRHKMIEHAQQSDEYHKERQELLNKVDKLQQKISETIAQLEEKRGEFAELDAEINEAREARKKDSHKERDDAAKKQKAIEKKIKKRINDAAQPIYEKFKAGEKLSMEELLILRESGML